MALKARCPNCKKLRPLECFICNCGLELKKARKAGKVNYHARFKVNGRRREFSLGRSLANAKAEYRRLKHELHNTGTVQSRQKMTVDDYYRDFYLPDQKRRNKGWDKVQGRYNKYLRPIFGHYRLMAIKGHHITKYITDRLAMKTSKGTTPKPATVNRELAVLKRIFNQAKGDDLFSGDNPVQGKTAGTEKHLFGNHLTERQGADLIRNLPEDNRGLLVEFLLATGLRYNNAACLKWDQVDTETKFLYLPDTKTGAAGIPLNDWALSVISRTERIPGCEIIFPHTDSRYRGRPYGQIRKTLKSALKGAGITEHIRIHDLRHTYASWLQKKGENISNIADLLTHKNKSTTFRYIHATTETLMKASNKISRPGLSSNETQTPPFQDTSRQRGGKGGGKDIIQIDFTDKKRVRNVS